MNTDDKESIKKVILKKIIELQEEIKFLRESAKPIEPDSAYGRLSRMDAINNKAIVDAALSDKITTLDRFKYTLSRIDTKEYGKCSKCGEDIAIKRLMSIPYANLCIKCAAKYR